MSQRGGLKLKNPDKGGFKAIYDMIQSPNSTLSLLTYKSLKGFMIALEVDPDHAEYAGLIGGKFQQTVTHLLLKFAVITPNNDTEIPNYKNVSKASESAVSFYEEAKLQQTIWKKSIIGGNPEICPSVANLSLFDNSTASRLLSFMQQHGDTNIQDMMSYLMGVIRSNSTYGIGCIAMPLVRGAVTLGNITHDRYPLNGQIVTDDMKDTIHATLIAQTVRLFISIGVIHFDLHSDNSLIYINDKNELQAIIIDFGRASNVMEEVPDEYLSVTMKHTLQESKEQFWNEFMELNNNTTDVLQKQQYMTKVMDFIVNIEQKINTHIFGREIYQTRWYRFVRISHEIMAMSFNELQHFIIITADSARMYPKTISQYERKGNLPQFQNVDANAFYVPFDYAPPEDANGWLWDVESSWCPNDICTISGGGRKRRKGRSAQRSRKSKSNKRPKSRRSTRSKRHKQKVTQKYKKYTKRTKRKRRVINGNWLLEYNRLTPID